jgi:Flp pilus assembly protein TadG
MLGRSRLAQSPSLPEVVMRINALTHRPARTRLLGRLARDKRGSAAVEFAFLAPLLTLMLLGTIELGRAINMDRVFTMATETTGDLVAREQYLGTSSTDAKTNLDAMMLSVKQVMLPYDSSSLALGVISVQASPTNAADTRVVWSYSYNGKTVPSKCATYTLPSGMLAKGGSTIVVESSFLFKPLFTNVIPGLSGNVNWADKSYHSPRNSCVDYVKGDNCSSLSC